SSVTPAKAMNLVPRRPFSQLITQTTRAFLVSTAWLRALWPTLTRRRRLAAAVRRCLRASAEVGGVVLIIDAKNDRAAQWYASYGAVPLSGKPLTLVMSLASFAAALKAAEQL